MDDLDLENREPCPDGRCVGVIGRDGRCGVCAQGRDGVAADATPDPGPPADESPGPSSAAEAEPVATEIDTRILCRDGRCVGIVGPDGRCGTCGRSGSDDFVPV